MRIQVAARDPKTMPTIVPVSNIFVLVLSLSLLLLCEQ